MVLMTTSDNDPAGLRLFSCHANIEAPPRCLFEILADVRQWATWYPGVLAVSSCEDGAAFSLETVKGPITGHVRTSWAPSFYRWTGTGVAGIVPRTDSSFGFLGLAERVTLTMVRVVVHAPTGGPAVIKTDPSQALRRALAERVRFEGPGTVVVSSTRKCRARY